MSYNRFIAEGYLGKDVEERVTTGSNPLTIAHTSLGITRKFSKAENKETDWVNLLAFGKTAEFMAKYCHKGTRVLIEAHVQTGSYTNKNGQKVFTTEFVVDSVEILTPKSGNSTSTPASAPAPTTGADDFMSILDGIDEELPFN